MSKFSELDIKRQQRRDLILGLIADAIMLAMVAIVIIVILIIL